jgi:hypothetical protein
MADTVENLILDLLEWVSDRERTYEDTMSAWRTSCPRLPVWEDANDRGLVEIAGDLVRVTAAGEELLGQRPRRQRESPRENPEKAPLPCGRGSACG